jgi:hypothetical protein
MDISESSITIHGRGGNKRKWIPAEDDELIKALVDVSLDPRWSDGSFKNGYTSVLEARLAEKLPDARISAAPHIESRLRYFKTVFCFGADAEQEWVYMGSDQEDASVRETTV